MVRNKQGLLFFFRVGPNLKGFKHLWLTNWQYPFPGLQWNKLILNISLARKLAFLYRNRYFQLQFSWKIIDEQRHLPTRTELAAVLICYNLFRSAHSLELYWTWVIFFILSNDHKLELSDCLNDTARLRVLARGRISEWLYNIYIVSSDLGPQSILKTESSTLSL